MSDLSSVGALYGASHAHLDQEMSGIRPSIEDIQRSDR
jgi:hypothetical protein